LGGVEATPFGEGGWLVGHTNQLEVAAHHPWPHLGWLVRHLKAGGGLRATLARGHPRSMGVVVLCFLCIGSRLYYPFGVVPQ
jgi:hypothetical protein